MRDLVETVIDGLLTQERLQQHTRQQHATQQKQHLRATQRKTASQPINPMHLQHSSTRIASADKQKDPALWKVSRQFESIFLQQMMSEMRKTVDKSEFLPTGFAEDIHASMMDEAIAGASVKQHSFGIADAIYRQLEQAQQASRGVHADAASAHHSEARTEARTEVRTQGIQGIAAAADISEMDHHQFVEAGSNAH